MEEKGKKEASIRGGLFDSAAWNYQTDDRTKIRRAYTQIWGRITTAPKSGIENVPFARAKVTVRKGITMEAKAFGNTQAQKALAAAERGDMVLVLGQREQTLYHSKKNDRDQWTKDVVAAFVVRGRAVELLHALYEVHEKITIGIPKFLLFLWDRFGEEAKKYSEEYDKPDGWD